jgi:hypothetical protein
MKSSSLFTVITLFILCISSAASASDFLSGTIEVVRADNYDVGGFFIKVNGTMSGTQTCTYPNGGVSRFTSTWTKRLS